MAFCTKCGRELTPGQVCVCQRNYAENGRTGQSVGTQSAMGNAGRQNTDNMIQQGVGRATSQSAENMAQQNMRRAVSQDAENITQQNVKRTISQNAGAVQPGVQSAVNIKEQSASLVSNVIEVFLAVLKAPVSAGRKVVIEGRVAIGVSLIILQAFFTGLFGVIMISKINELIAGAAGSASDSLLEYASVSLVKLSYVRGFLISVLGSAALSFLVALIAMLLMMLFRGKTTYTSMLLATGIRCVGMIPVTVLAILVSILHVGWGIVIFMVSAIIGYIFMGRVLTAGSVFVENKVPYVLFLLVILTVVVQYFMISKIWPLYMPDVLRASYYDFLREMKGESRGLSGMLKNIFDY